MSLELVNESIEWGNITDYMVFTLHQITPNYILTD